MGPWNLRGCLIEQVCLKVPQDEVLLGNNLFALYQGTTLVVP
jgi:hypothetical protein